MAKRCKKKVLVVDDEPGIRELIRRVLSKDFAVIEAGNGKEAVKSAQSKKPSIILMDMMMPQMDGLTACYIIKKDKATRDIPVIMLTAIDSEANKKLAIEAWGADAYLKKPFEFRTLTDTIDHFLSNQSKA